jgi:hypothetical protein
MRQGSIRLEAVVSPVISYCMYQCGIPVVKSVKIMNASREEVARANVHVTTQPPFSDVCSRVVEAILPGEPIELAQFPLRVSEQYLAGVQERFTGTLQATLEKDGEILARDETPIDVIPFDEWLGILAMPELLASFVTPADPRVGEILRAASGILEQWSGDPSLPGYRCMEPNRVRIQVAAA